MKDTIALACFTLLALPGSADAYELICADGERQYLVSYEEDADYIRVTSEGVTTAYEVRLSQNNNEQYVVVAELPNDGPMISLKLRPTTELQYWVDKKLVQTDACREP